MLKHNLRVLKNIKISEDVYKLVLEGTINSLPGQFVNIKVSDMNLLRRPLSIYDDYNNTLTIIYKVVGEGTKKLSLIKENEYLDILGPLGKGYPLVKNKKVLVIGGGIGVPPLNYLARVLSKDNEVISVLGFRNKTQIILKEELEKYGKCFVSTDDGSFGFNGNVLKCIDDNNIDFDVLYACGPKKMLYFIDKKYQGIKEGYISMEERMACGIGICYGCAVHNKNNKNHMLRVCKEGPVFELGVIDYGEN